MFKVIAEHQDFIVVNKAAGVNFHDEGNLGTGLHAQVKAYVIKQTTIKELYPVHRLDKMTSGLVIFAKTLPCAQIFGQLFEQHHIDKYYLALSDKKPTKKQGLIKGDMAKSRRGMFKLLRSANNPAVTQFFSYAVGNKQRLYLLKPHSGKTHQLRVALSSIGAPIIGDVLYYSNNDNVQQSDNVIANIDRGYLHAYALKFSYLDEQYEFINPPSDVEHYLTEEVIEKLVAIKKPWLLNWPRL